MGSPACGYRQETERGDPCQHVLQSNAIVAVERARRRVAARVQGDPVARVAQRLGVAGVAQVVLGDCVQVGRAGFAEECGWVGKVVWFVRVVGEGEWWKRGGVIGMQ